MAMYTGFIFVFVFGCNEADLKFFLRDQKAKLVAYLPQLQALPLNANIDDLMAQKQHAVLNISLTDLRECDFSFLFQYAIFPPQILDYFGEWQLGSRDMQVGDVIVQQAKIPPWPLSVKLLFGVKILSVFREKKRMGFSYGTLKGHPERGVNTFSFALQAEKLIVEVCTLSTPDVWLSKSLNAVFTRYYIRFCNQQALKLMQGNFLQANNKWLLN